MLQEVRKVPVKAVAEGRRTQVAREVIVAHVHVEILSVIEVSGAESTKLRGSARNIGVSE